MCNIVTIYFQTDGQKIQNRGARRFNSKSTTESSTLSALETKSPRNKSSRSETASVLENHETNLTREGSIRTRSKLKQSQAGVVSATTSRTSSRHLNTSADNSRNRPKSHATQTLREEITRDAHGDNKENVPEPQTPKRLTASRRTLDVSPVRVDDTKLDHEAFTKAPDLLRSKTGRKLYVNHPRESKREVISSRKPLENENVEKAESPTSELGKEQLARLEISKAENVASKVNAMRRIDTQSANSSSNRKDEPKDVLLSASESVRVDIPLRVGENGEDLTFATTISSVSSRQASRSVKEKVESNDIARSSAKKSRQSDRPNSRNRSKTRDLNLETANPGGTSRRGSSKFGDTATAETSERTNNSRHRSNAKSSRGRSGNRSKDASATEARSSGRQRNADTDSETNANRRTETRRKDRMSEGKRRSKDGRSKAAEVKVDEQDIRTQSRSRSRVATSNLGNL